MDGGETPPMEKEGSPRSPSVLKFENPTATHSDSEDEVAGKPAGGEAMFESSPRTTDDPDGPPRAGNHHTLLADALKNPKSFLQGMFYGTSGEEGGGLTNDELLKHKWFGLLHPDTPIRGAYDFLQLVILIYLAWELPNRLAFQKTPKGYEIYTDLFIDFLVWTDMFLSMNMFQYDDKTKVLITDRARIKKDYIHSWFLVDLFSVFPLDQMMLLIGTFMVESDTSGHLVAAGYEIIQMSATARMLRLIRLVRLARLAKLLNVEQIVNTLYFLTKNLGVTKLQLQFYFSVFFLVMVMIGGAHFLGCMWLMIGRDGALYEVTPTGWMISLYDLGDSNMTKDYIMCIGGNFVDAEWNALHGSSCNTTDTSCDKDNGEVCGIMCDPIPSHERTQGYDVDCSWIQGKGQVEGAVGEDDGVGVSQSSQYLTAFYFTLVTLSTVGYGDIGPKTPMEKQFVVFVIVVGAFMYAYIIGNFSEMISNMKKEKSLYAAKMRSVNDLLAYIDAPIELRGRIQDYFDFRYRNKEGADFVDELPVNLQIELLKQRWGTLITRVPFFVGLKDRTVVTICQKMTKFVASPGTAFMEKGSVHDELLILSKGNATTEATDEGGELVTHDPGMFWGEMQFLGVEEARTTTVTAAIYCEVASLSPDDIAELLASNAPVRDRFAGYAKMRLEVDRSLKSGEELQIGDIQKRLEALQDAFLDDEEDSANRNYIKGRPVGSCTNEQLMQVLVKQESSVRELAARMAEVEGALKGVSSR